MPMIKCTDEQAYLIELCLDTMGRASLGQLTHFVESIEAMTDRGSLRTELLPPSELTTTGRKKLTEVPSVCYTVKSRIIRKSIK